MPRKNKIGEKERFTIRGMVFNFVSSIVPKIGEVSITAREEDTYESAKPILKMIIEDWERNAKPQWSAARKKAWRKALGLK